MKLDRSRFWERKEELIVGSVIVLDVDLLNSQWDGIFDSANARRSKSTSDGRFWIMGEEKRFAKKRKRCLLSNPSNICRFRRIVFYEKLIEWEREFSRKTSFNRFPVSFECYRAARVHCYRKLYCYRKLRYQCYNILIKISTFSRYLLFCCFHFLITSNFYNFQ